MYIIAARPMRRAAAGCGPPVPVPAATGGGGRPRACVCGACVRGRLVLLLYCDGQHIIVRCTYIIYIYIDIVIVRRWGDNTHSQQPGARHHTQGHRSQGGRRSRNSAFTTF